MKYIVSIFIGGVIAYIQSSSSKGIPDFTHGAQPLMFHFIAISLFSIVVGVFASFRLSKNDEQPNDGQVRFIDEFTIIATIALGIGIFSITQSGNSFFMVLITPYFGFGLASGLVTGKLFFTFYNKN